MRDIDKIQPIIIDGEKVGKVTRESAPKSPYERQRQP